LARRQLEQAAQPSVAPTRGYERLYYESVLQADEGCDFGFLQGRSASSLP
jgi:hypothetical protein